MKKVFLFVLVLTIFFSSTPLLVLAQNTQLSDEITINWTEPITFSKVSGTQLKALHFSDASYNIEKNNLPILTIMVAVPSGTTDFDFNMYDDVNINANLAEQQIMMRKKLEVSPQVETAITWIKKKPYALIKISPIYRNAAGQLLKTTQFKYQITPKTNNSIKAKSTLSYKSTSVLSAGKWAKMGVTKNGVYKVTYEQMVSLGIISSAVSSESIRVFGNGGHHLPFNNSSFRIDDLAENAIELVDGNDNTFDPGDFIAFYGEGPHQWNFDGSRFNHVQHLFSDTNYYFLTADYNIGIPKRISGANIPSDPADVTVNTFKDFQVHEVDQVNFVKSGRNWYGESFSFTKTYSFNFNFPNLVANTQEIKARSAFRVINRPSSLTYSINGTTILSLADNSGVGGGVYDTYANVFTQIAPFNSNTSNINLQVQFSNPSSSDNAWIDYIEILTDRSLTLTGNQLSFRHPASMNATVINYNLTNTGNYSVWNVTNHLAPEKVTISNGSFKASGGQLNEFIAIQNNQYLTPQFFGSVPNQNLHAIQQADYIIISHPNFLMQAEQLANHHRNHSKLNTLVVTPQQIYNEFSSGAQDLTAIKSFLKMIYDRNVITPEAGLKYVLLFGDASYDMKKRISPNTNFIPSYQSWNSESPLNSYVSDDYIGLLDDDESDKLTDGVDIGIGRFVAQNNVQAQTMVNKVINYQTSPNALGAWHNWLTFVGDDEDNLIHMSQSDEVARGIKTAYPNYNKGKIYLDAYPQVSNAGGSTYPEVNIAIDNATEKGCLIMNYIGHGGELGWAHERVLGLTQINNYQNYDRLPLFVTATCEFSRFDDPARTSGGELLHLNPTGGAIGLLTTTRLVYSGPNFKLVKKFFAAVFEKQNNQYPAIGDVLLAAKFGESSVNGRNFTLLGDPAMNLRYPDLNVATTIIPDTIKSLQKIKIEGIITDENGNQNSNYNGTLYPTVFDKTADRQTLNNDGLGIFNYQEQVSALFNGKVSVTNGAFSFEFVVPKDINFDFGNGKISYFSEDGKLTASGNEQNFIVGGRDGDPNADQQGPTVNVFLNDESFIEGGMTDENPMLYATLFDENGINTVGTGIGHDITAIIDEKTTNPIILNDFYTSNLNTYQSGTVSYNLNNLSEGKHTLRLKAWDVYNNSGEGITTFYVSKSSEFNIKHVLNYPNPFTTNTDFYFEHNAIGQMLTIRVQIFTISGKLVRTIDQVQQSENYRSAPINWNGLDDFNDKLAKGTYVYRIKVTNALGQTAEKFEKIVIL